MPLPPGFELDDPKAAAAAGMGLPEGFELDEPAAGSSIPEVDLINKLSGWLLDAGKGVLKGSGSLLARGAGLTAEGERSALPTERAKVEAGAAPPIDLQHAAAQAEQESGTAESPGDPTAEKIGRTVGKMLPQLAVAHATGGLSIPAQAAAQGGAMAAQAALEGADPEGVAVSGALGAGAPLVGPALAKIAGKVGAPLASKVSPEIEAAATRRGVELPASALSESKVVPLIEASSSKYWGGAKTAERYATAAADIAAQADHLAASASKVGTDALLNGSVIAKGFLNYRSAWVRAKNALYRDAAIPQDLTIDTTGTVETLDAILADKTGAARLTGESTNYGMLKNLRDQLAKGRFGVVRQVNASDVRAALKELNGRIGGAYADAWSAANKGLLKKVAASLSDDFEAGLAEGAPEVAEKLTLANRTYAEGLQKINSAFGKRIFRLAKQDEYGKIAQAASGGALTTDNLPGIMEALGDEATDSLRASVLTKIVGDAKNPSTGMLTPEGIARGIKRFGPDTLETLLTPEQFERLSDLGSLSKALSKGSRVQEGSQTAFLGRLAFSGGIAISNPLLALKMLLGDYAFNRFIGSRYGQKWLTTGFKLLPEVLESPGGRSLAQGLALYGATAARTTPQPESPETP